MKSKICKHCGAVIEGAEWLKIPELKIEVSKPKEYTKPYNEMEIPEGCRLVKIWELFWIYESKYKDFIFGEDGYVNFACEQLDIDKKNKWSRWLCRSRYDDLFARVDNLLYADEDGRVVFVRELK